jgi:tRNA pseudouridine13 synthase
MFGWKVKPLPTGEVGEAEGRLWAAEGLPEGALRSGKGETEGARRPYAVPVGDVQVAQEGLDLWLSFRLPRGSYATVLLDEVMKHSVAGQTDVASAGAGEAS